MRRASCVSRKAARSSPVGEGSATWIAALAVPAEGSVVTPLDVFVVKYDQRGQRELAVHRDNGLLTFSLLLSDPTDFEGGGTLFEAAAHGANVSLVIVTNGDKGGHCYNSTGRFSCGPQMLAATRARETGARRRLARAPPFSRLGGP